MTCDNCDKDRPTRMWLGSEGVMLMVHGGGAQWCEVCILTARLEHARERADAIPDLERDLMEAKAAAIADDVLARVK